MFRVILQSPSDVAVAAVKMWARAVIVDSTICVSVTLMSKYESGPADDKI